MQEKYTVELDELVRVTRLLQQDEACGFLPGALTSIKSEQPDLLGVKEEVLHILNCLPYHPVSLENFTVLHTTALARLVQLEGLKDEELENAIAVSRIRSGSPVPPLAALTHAALPYRCILAAQPVALLAVACTPEGKKRLQEACGEGILYLPYSADGLPMARACTDAVGQAGSEKVAGIFVEGHGILTFGESAQEAFERMEIMVQKASAYLKNVGAWNVPDTTGTDGGYETRPTNTGEREIRMGKQLAALRKAVSLAAGKPLILAREDLARHATLVESEATEIRPAIAAHTPYLRHHLLAGQDLEVYVKNYSQAFKACDFENVPAGLDLAPRVILDQDLGLCTLGRTAKEASLAYRLFSHTASVAAGAAALGVYHPLPEADLLAYELAHQQDWSEAAPFTGEVVLVTGGASGIGKACVEALLQRGAAVVSLDVNPKVTNLYERANYLGLECDLTDEASVLKCFETFTRAFGGLDMLVLNAGVFPAGCRIESLTLEEWQRVMRINLDSNLVVMRESHPLLKQSPRGGRVLVNASKNVLAPGAGAVAYSASKAAVTQMARVAALEWGKDGIRVNMIHPDAVFDTGIWSEEVLRARAAHYGMSVQQYKTRNVLGVELNSHYVAELVTEMLGEKFEKITGAQIPVDGGSDRVI